MGTMTSRERWLALLKREKPDRMPMGFWGTPEIKQKLMGHLGCDDEVAMQEKLHIDPVISVGPAYAGPLLVPGYNMYGSRFEQIPYQGGFYEECVYHPLAQLVYAVTRDQVSDVWVEGECLLENGVACRVNEEYILDAAQEIASRIAAD